MRTTKTTPVSTLSIDSLSARPAGSRPVIIVATDRPSLAAALSEHEGNQKHLEQYAVRFGWTSALLGAWRYECDQVSAIRSKLKGAA